MEHQYPGAISDDGNMLAELMLPDQTHMRQQDWTMFFLHKDATLEEEEAQEKKARRQKRRDKIVAKEDALLNGDTTEADLSDDESESEDEEDGGEGPPLMYVLNLVNTKQDNTVKRGAIVKAMAICTRHSFLHIYKPLLLLALEDYFKSPYPETLMSLYDALNGMDLSLMPRLSLTERHILQASDAKDMFVEKFEKMIQQRVADEEIAGKSTAAQPESPSKTSTPKYTLPRDTHEFESRVVYNSVTIPVKVPTAISPETVGDFSLVKLIQTFGGPHQTQPQPFALHPHLTSSGAYTHPILVLLNAVLTQKRIIFLGHNRPSGEVAEAVLAACALASGGVLRGFTRHAFPYTDLTKIDELLKVPGFIAGVTNPAFANHPEWWDLLCDLPSGRMKISSKIEGVGQTEGMLYWMQQNPGFPVNQSASTKAPDGSTVDPTGDAFFMDDIGRSITNRLGESVIRARFRAYILKFTRIAAAFEESVYGASALYVISPVEAEENHSIENQSPQTPMKSSFRTNGTSTNSTTSPQKSDSSTGSLKGHGYVWPSEESKARELAASVSRIEGWRNTRSYYSFISDLASHHSHAHKDNASPSSNISPAKAGSVLGTATNASTIPTLRNQSSSANFSTPPRNTNGIHVMKSTPRLDLHHHLSRLRTLRLTSAESAAIYTALSAYCNTPSAILELLDLCPSSEAGLFYITLGLWHEERAVRESTADLIGRISENDAGRVLVRGVGGWAQMGLKRVMTERRNAEEAVEMVSLDGVAGNGRIS